MLFFHYKTLFATIINTLNIKCWCHRTVLADKLKNCKSNSKQILDKIEIKIKLKCLNCINI